MSKRQPAGNNPASKMVQKRQPGGDNGVIRFRCYLQNTTMDVMRARGWQEVKEESGEWDINWCDVGWMKELFDRSYMDEYARISHFRNHYELTRKNLMIKNLKRLKKQIEKDSGKSEASACDFFPVSYELPSEYHIFVEEFKRNPGLTWIMKPAGSAQGKGIFLFKKLKDITDWKKGEYQPPQHDKEKEKEGPKTYIVQRYLENPYLIGGRKSDIRLYVLVISYAPLKAWVYREGFARFSNSRYSMESIDDTYVHLTNVAVQKTAPDYDPEKGCKWSMRQLRQYLTARHGMDMVEVLMNKINNIIILSLQSVQKIMINDKHCFELYGYDILLDNNLKPWLIEVNASPSLTASSQEDYNLKFALIDDVMNVLDMERRLTGNEKRIGGFDLLWYDGPVYANEGTGLECSIVNNNSNRLNSYIGCVNDRKKQLNSLYRYSTNKNETREP